MESCIIGNPENRRVRDFQAAAERIGVRRPGCVSWCELLDGSHAALRRIAAADQVRIDSPGENDGVLRRLLQLGGSAGSLAFGEVGLLREQYRGFCAILDRVSGISASFQNPPIDVKVMFDKWRSHKRFAAACLARPATWLAPTTLDGFRNLRRECCSASSGRLFLKPRYASSASGVCAYRWSDSREQLIAPIQIHHDGEIVRLYNSLKIRQYTSLEQIDAILGQLLPQGMICERWIRKASLPDGQFDLRIVVIRGEARHVVVRQSHHPMTNLHLGNRRGSIDEVQGSFGRRILDACKRLAEGAAACFPDSLYAGVDVLVPAKGEPIVCEINAFGDLLPNVTDRGESVYEAILRSSRIPGTANCEYQS